MSKLNLLNKATTVAFTPSASLHTLGIFAFNPTLGFNPILGFNYTVSISFRSFSTSSSLKSEKEIVNNPLSSLKSSHPNPSQNLFDVNYIRKRNSFIFKTSFTFFDIYSNNAKIIYFVNQNLDYGNYFVYIKCKFDKNVYRMI